ncbi:hypothetical protein HOLleu_39948 [Holothuria leucospilota]|uniref:Uncharacterized protein n=1 Tax=Holothuria leucospilota TaxID=206669 RepID=A0A9Q1BCN8_HOLLE|nr:hypothetical protein HOLleu_39948 [Holothuria leucospilota]
MATQKGVQDYLEKHKISALFEDLMSRLVHTLPSEPVPYLIKILQRFEEKAKKQIKETTKPRPPTAKTIKSPATPTEAKRSRPTVVRTISSGTSEWTMLQTLPGMGEDRGYDRPWVQNMKKITRSPDSSVEDVPRARKPKRTETKVSPDVEKQFKPKERSKSSAKLTANSELWAVEGEESASRMPAPSDQPRPTSQQQEETLMKEELSTKSLGRKVSREERTSKEESVQEVVVEQRRARPGKKAKEHKKELAELVAKQREVETLTYLDTGEEDPAPDEGGFEEATDVLEDADELMDEGISNVKSTGQKVKKKKSSKSQDSQVKVTMCSTCARVIKGDGSSEIRGSGYRAFSSIESSVSSSFVVSGSHAGLMSDDDFESASQVSGPRQPVWESEGEDAASATQRTVHDGTSELFQTGGRGASHLPPSFTSATRHQAWGEGSDVGDDRTVTRTETLTPRGHTWQRSDDEDSSV